MMVCSMTPSLTFFSSSKVSCVITSSSMCTNSLQIFLSIATISSAPQANLFVLQNLYV
jgi:hypothetical protein